MSKSVEGDGSDVGLGVVGGVVRDDASVGPLSDQRPKLVVILVFWTKRRQCGSPMSLPRGTLPILCRWAMGFF
jgi:hypothetical protein